MTIQTDRESKVPVPSHELDEFVAIVKQKVNDGFTIMGHGNDMVQFGKFNDIKILDGCAALRSVWGDTNRPKCGGSLSLIHLVPTLGVRHAELHQSFEDSVDTVLVYRALLPPITDKLRARRKLTKAP